MNGAGEQSNDVSSSAASSSPSVSAIAGSALSSVVELARALITPEMLAAVVLRPVFVKDAGGGGNHVADDWDVGYGHHHTRAADGRRGSIDNSNLFGSHQRSDKDDSGPALRGDGSNPASGSGAPHQGDGQAASALSAPPPPPQGSGSSVSSVFAAISNAVGIGGAHPRSPDQIGGDDHSNDSVSPTGEGTVKSKL